MTDTPESPETPNEPDGAEAEARDESAKPDLPPDRLSLNPSSRFFDADLLQRGVGIRFKGKERFNVEEYCISESWIRVQAGKSRDRRGNPMTVRLDGPVEAWFRDSED